MKISSLAGYQTQNQNNKKQNINFGAIETTERLMHAFRNTQAFEKAGITISWDKTYVSNPGNWLGLVLRDSLALDGIKGKSARIAFLKGISIKVSESDIRELAKGNRKERRIFGIFPSIKLKKTTLEEDMATLKQDQLTGLAGINIHERMYTPNLLGTVGSTF